MNRLRLCEMERAWVWPRTAGRGPHPPQTSRFARFRNRIRWHATCTRIAHTVGGAPAIRLSQADAGRHAVHPSWGSGPWPQLYHRRPLVFVRLLIELPSGKS